MQVIRNGHASAGWTAKHFADSADQIPFRRRQSGTSIAYFVPDDGMVEALLDAVERGVKVEILIPAEDIPMNACH
ncbi:MAG: hypothetical protein R3E95_22215 [Thiolinea sp.]